MKIIIKQSHKAQFVSTFHSIYTFVVVVVVEIAFAVPSNWNIAFFVQFDGIQFCRFPLSCTICGKFLTNSVIIHSWRASRWQFFFFQISTASHQISTHRFEEKKKKRLPWCKWAVNTVYRYKYILTTGLHGDEIDSIWSLNASNHSHQNEERKTLIATERKKSIINPPPFFLPLFHQLLKLVISFSVFEAIQHECIIIHLESQSVETYI